MGRITETHIAIVIVTMVTVYVCRETNIYLCMASEFNING